MTDNSYINWPTMCDDALAKHIGGFTKHHLLRKNRCFILDNCYI